MIVRPLENRDRGQVEDGIRNDPEHTAKGLTPDFFFTPGTESIVFEDEQGPVFALRLSHVMRVDMQFYADVDKGRVAKTLVEGFEWLRDRGRAQGYTEMIFESVSKLLVRFCQRRLGFKASPHEQLLYIGK